ncbi:SHOCT domain-containing protein [Halorarius litoreus]|uniref:SHOCT domain-containing protein n=1 Tax=Halorarius litoreus TaxID=2962676 RepID=UPI0020CE7D3D|nr:SHOCT domain-containing protein [Halorarius litoreus]
MGVAENLRNEASGVVALLVLGLGFAALFTGQSWFWLVWVIGFAVVLPLVSIAFGLDDDEDEPEPPRDEDAEALEELKRRYARGELDEDEFEARLERLLETEDVEAAREYVERGRERREAE